MITNYIRFICHVILHVAKQVTCSSMLQKLVAYNNYDTTYSRLLTAQLNQHKGFFKFRIVNFFTKQTTCILINQGMGSRDLLFW